MLLYVTHRPSVMRVRHRWRRQSGVDGDQAMAEHFHNIQYGYAVAKSCCVTRP